MPDAVGSTGSASSATAFSAADAAVGYLYQTRVALLQALRRLSEEQTFSIYLETLDDVVFEPDGDALELLQVKHHKKGTASLTDASPDLWKTLRVWIEGRASGAIPLDAQLFLVTTAAVGAGSAASCLQAADRDETIALQRLTATATTSTSGKNALAYGLFRNLPEADQAALISSVTVLPGTSDITDVDAELRREVWSAARSEHRQSFLSRLEGWWYDRTLRQLRDMGNAPISSAELQFTMDDLRDQFHHEALPVDEDLRLREVDISLYADSPFVRQLEISGIKESRVLRAVRDYYRAFTQRSRWMREELVHVGELGRYERRLTEEWEILFDQVADEIGEEAAEEACRKAAQRLCNWVEGADFPIRPKVVERGLTRGSLHMLADELKVGWHPRFRERLEHLLKPEAAE